MPDNKSISQLTTAEQLSQSDLFETSIPNGALGYLSRKASLEAIANFIANNLNYSDLQTVAKTLIGAINEAAQSGGGGASIEEMTQAQYNALTPAQKADGTLRAISDATTSISDIDDVNVSSPADGNVLAYDSTSSEWFNFDLGAFDSASTASSNPVTCANSTYTKCVQLSIDKGLYLCIGMLGFDSNTAGVRGINISTTSGDSGIVATQLTVNACQSGQTRFQTVNVIKVNNDASVYYLNAYQNSGGNLDVVYSRLLVVKIGM